MTTAALRVGLLAALLPACGSDTARAPTEPPPRGVRQRGFDPSETPSQFSVGIRVRLDRADVDEPRVNLATVAYDMDGNADTVDLGTFIGRVAEGEPIGEELAAVRVLSSQGPNRRISLIPTDEEIEVWARPLDQPDAPGEVIQRIPVPAGTEAQPRGLEIVPESR